MYCTADLCQTVNKKEKREQCLYTDVSVHEMYSLSSVETEDTFTPARLKSAVVKLPVFCASSDVWSKLP